MPRIELYLDTNDTLTVDFFLNSTTEVIFIE